MPRHHRTESKTSPRRLAAFQRQQQALEMCLGGATYTQIAQALGYPYRSGAYRAIKAAQARLVQPGVEELRQRNMERCNRMRLGLAGQQFKGDGKAIELELRIQEREARYLGLDQQPTDEGAQAAAVAVVQVVIQVGDKAIPLGEWRRTVLAVGDGKGDGQDQSQG